MAGEKTMKVNYKDIFNNLNVEYFGGELSNDFRILCPASMVYDRMTVVDKDGEESVTGVGTRVDLKNKDIYISPKYLDKTLEEQREALFEVMKFIDAWRLYDKKDANLKPLPVIK